MFLEMVNVCDNRTYVYKILYVIECLQFCVKVGLFSKQDSSPISFITLNIHYKDHSIGMKTRVQGILTFTCSMGLV